MKEKKKNQESYELTAYGLLCAELLNNKVAKVLWDVIELYGWKHFSKGGVPAIVLKDDGVFVTLKERGRK